jgi:hypothetical protein
VSTFSANAIFTQFSEQVAQAAMKTHEDDTLFLNKVRVAWILSSHGAQNPRK